MLGGVVSAGVEGVVQNVGKQAAELHAGDREILRHLAAALQRDLRLGKARGLDVQQRVYHAVCAVVRILIQRVADFVQLRDGGLRVAAADERLGGLQLVADVVPDVRRVLLIGEDVVIVGLLLIE